MSDAEHLRFRNQAAAKVLASAKEAAAKVLASAKEAAAKVLADANKEAVKVLAAAQLTSDKTHTDSQESAIKAAEVVLAATTKAADIVLAAADNAAAELKRTETIRFENNERYTAIIQTAMDGFILLDMRGHLLEVNETYCLMTGYSRQELLAITISDLEAAETIQDTVVHIQNIISQGADRFESKQRRKDGTIIDVEVTVQYRNIAGGQLVAFIRDISDRNKTKLYREMGREVLQTLNESVDVKESIHRAISVLKARTGFDAVGIRLKHNDDFPYFDQNGFSTDFLLTENSVIERDADGCLCRDKSGNVVLECTCGLVISGKTDPTLPFFTSGAVSGLTIHYRFWRFLPMLIQGIIPVIYVFMKAMPPSFLCPSVIMRGYLVFFS